MESQRGKGGGKGSGKRSIVTVPAKALCKKFCSEQKTCLKSAFNEKSMQCRFKGKIIQVFPLFTIFLNFFIFSDKVSYMLQVSY